MTNWTDIPHLTPEERGELLAIVHDSRLQRIAIESANERAFIIFDLKKQLELLDLAMAESATESADGVSRDLAMVA